MNTVVIIVLIFWALVIGFVVGILWLVNRLAGAQDK